MIWRCSPEGSCPPMPQTVLRRTGAKPACGSRRGRTCWGWQFCSSFPTWRFAGSGYERFLGSIRPADLLRPSPVGRARARRLAPYRRGRRCSVPANGETERLSPSLARSPMPEEPVCDGARNTSDVSLFVHPKSFDLTQPALRLRWSSTPSPRKCLASWQFLSNTFCSFTVGIRREPVPGHPPILEEGEE